MGFLAEFRFVQWVPQNILFAQGMAFSDGGDDRSHVYNGAFRYLLRYPSCRALDWTTYWT